MDNNSNSSSNSIHLKYADAIFENTLNAILFINNEGIILDANPASAILFTYPTEELINQSLFHFISSETPQNTDLFWEHFQKVSEKETCLSFSNTKRELKHIKVSGSLNIDANIHLIILKDISIKYNIQQHLIESEKRLYAIIETGQECIKLLGPKCEVLEINSAGLAMIDIEDERDVIGKSVLPFIVEEYRDAFANLTHDVFQGKSGKLIFEMHSSKGKHFWLEIKAVPLFDETNKTVSAMLGVTQNITERKKAEESLIQSERLLHNIIEFSPIPLLISRISDGKVFMANHGIEKMVGREKSLLIGETTSQYYVNKSDRELIVNEMLTKGKITGRDLDIQDVNGNIKSMIISCRFIFTENENMLLTAFVDITERKQKDVLLETTKNNLESIVNALPDLLFRFDKDNRYAFFHANTTYKLLATPEFFLGKKITEVLPPSLAKLAEEKLDKTRLSNQLEIFEYSQENEENETEWFESRMINTHNDEVLVIIRNITAQKKGDLAIIESEHKFRSLVQDLTVGVFVQGANEEITLTNAATLDLLGLTEEEMIGQKPYHPEWKTIHEDGSIFLREDYPAVKAGITLQPIRNITIGVLSPRKKDIVWLRVDATPLTDEEGKLVQVVCTLSDITINKKAEDALHKSEDNLRTVFKNTDKGYILYNSQLRIISFNENAQVFAKQDIPKLLEVGGYFYDHLPPERIEYLQSMMSKVLKGEILEYETERTRPNNEKVWYHIKYSPVYTQSKNVSGFVMAVEDITKRKIDELELLNSFKLVTEQNERLLNFSYIVSHNLRSHTSNIKMILNLLEEEGNEQERTELLEDLKSVSELLNETIHNLNDVVSIQTNINTVLEKLNLKDYVLQALHVLNKQTIDKNIHIFNNIKTSIIILHNPAYLESILLNFISNAIKYSDPNKNAYIQLDAFTEDNRTVLQIKDNGIGIDLSKNGNKLFGMYKTFNGNSDARGLGLFITKNQIESMGGFIKTESELNVGSTFKIYFKQV